MLANFCGNFLCVNFTDEPVHTMFLSFINKYSNTYSIQYVFLGCLSSGAGQHKTFNLVADSQSMHPVRIGTPQCVLLGWSVSPDR